MDRGKFAEALTAYREAYAAEPSPALLYNMGRAYEKLGRYADAWNALDAFATTASADLKARVPRLDALMLELRSRVTQVTIRSNVGGAGIWIRGERIGTTPLARPYAVAPGMARLEVRADGYAAYTRDLVLEEGRVLVVDVGLVPVSSSVTSTTSASETGATAASEPITKKWWFWTGVGAVVAGGAAVTVALLAQPRSAPQGDIEPRQVTAPLLKF